MKRPDVPDAPSPVLLVIRFSALGDVALAVPVVRQLLDAYPKLQIVFVSDKRFAALFSGIPRLTFHPADLKGRHRGLKGLWKLFRELRQYHITGVADLHQVLRSQVLRAFYTVTGLPFAMIRKGRREKRQLIRKKKKIFRPLRHTSYRYADVFGKLGFPLTLREEPPGFAQEPLPGDLQPLRESRQPDGKWIGIAPFARHAPKTYPPRRMEQVIEMLLAYPDVQLFLFGGGASETARLEEWAVKYPGIRVIAGKYSLAEELQVISRLDAMVSMDSANMHLASLCGVPVISVWGATHPYAGFTGFGQRPESAVQQNLYCRPCSVFGNRPCYRGDHACMEEMSPERVFDGLKQILKMA